ncbi:MAG: hypothetical protein GTN36_03950 [Candidatus Aenigmarchaeota archaeon]|nr:hypothetical protein [Candidatus Aenigmarchaeota archaeon]
MVIEHIEKSWKAYRKNFWPIITAMVLQFILVGIPFLIGIIPWVFIFLSYRTVDMITLLMSNLGALSFSLIMFAIGFLISIALTGGFVKMLYEALRGKTKYETMLKTAKEKFWTIIGANSLFILILLVLFIAVFSPLFILTGFSTTFSGAGSLTLLITIFSIATLGSILIILVSIFFVFINQAIVIDNLNAIDSVNKSFEVSKKSYLTILGLMIIFILLNSALVNLFSFFGTVLEAFVVTPLLLLSYTSVYLEKRRKK